MSHRRAGQYEAAIADFTQAKADRTRPVVDVLLEHGKAYAIAGESAKAVKALALYTKWGRAASDLRAYLLIRPGDSQARTLLQSLPKL